jgi:Mg2+ and Co2+ transporter CorA
MTTKKVDESDSFISDKELPFTKTPSTILRSDDAIESDTTPQRSLPRNKAVLHMPGLVLRAFEITEDAKVVPYKGEVHLDLANELSSEDQVKSYWVHLDADEADRRELNDWIDGLNLGNFMSDQIKRPTEDWMSHVVSTRTKALVVIRILPALDKHGKYMAHHVEYLAAILKNKALLTYTTSQSGRGNSSAVSRESMKFMTHEEVLHVGSSSAALLVWLEFHVLRTRTSVISLRKKATQLAMQLDADPKEVSLKDILDVGDNVMVVLSVAEEQAQSLAMVKNLDADPESIADSVDFTKLTAALSILIATAESTELMGRRLEKRAIGLKASYDAYQQEILNKRLALLTIVSSIFMPLTFMAGVYGMNFVNMPELETENGYFILLGSMLLITVLMTGGFYNNGWF